MRLGELGHQPVPGLGELDPDDPGVPRIWSPAHEASRFRPVQQPDRAVPLHHQVVRDLAHGGRRGPRVALDGYQQLMLHMGQAHLAGLVLAPALEPAQRDAEGEKVLEILLRRLNEAAPLIPVGINIPSFASRSRRVLLGLCI